MHSQLGKTIRLFLVDGSPLGLKTAEILNWTGKILSFPRGLLREALKRPEITRTGLYFLIGSDPDNAFRSLVYIGESDDVGQRLKNHDANESMDFFDQVVLVTNKDENLTKSHVRYLEYKLLEKTRANGETLLKNSTQGSNVCLPESDRSDMDYVIKQLQILLPVLGFNFLQEIPVLKNTYIADQQVNLNDSPTFELSYLEGQIYAESYLSDEGMMIVQAGAIIRHPTEATASVGQNYHKRLALLIETQAVELIPTNRSVLLLKQSIPFKDPSSAAIICCGAQRSGPKTWKIKGTNQTYGQWRAGQLKLVDIPSKTEPSP